MDRSTSEYAQTGLDTPSSAAQPLPEQASEPQSAAPTDTAVATASSATATDQYASATPVDVKQAAPVQYNGTPSSESQPGNGAPTPTPQPNEYTINTATAAAAAAATPQLSTPPASARTTTGGYPDYLARQPQYHPVAHPQASAVPGMAQATSPSTKTNQTMPTTSTFSASPAVGVGENQQEMTQPSVPSADDGSRNEVGQTPQAQEPSQTPQPLQASQAPQVPQPQAQPQVTPQAQAQPQAQPQAQGQLKSDTDLPIDPSMAPVAAPVYPAPYAAYQPQPHDMGQYAGHPPQVYGRPEWPPQYAQPAHHAIPAAYAPPATTVGTFPQSTAAPPRPGQTHYFSQVYSFVPIPGTQQHKRPRRRYEEIERMYKCGWNGCEKAYGTLNHLNAHVTMQSHGAKRTPEEFKEIRKEWKARKKEEEARRKAAEERERAAAAAQQATQQVEATATTADPSQQSQQASYTPTTASRPSLPPMGYQAADGQVPQPQYHTAPGNGLVYQTNNGQVPAGYHPAAYPHSPYGQGQQVYQQTHE